MFEEFCKNFDYVDNALKMKNLLRWNGRDLQTRETLAEHTHLVICCALKLIETFRETCHISITNEEELGILKRCVLHDSLEILYGDILTPTKDRILGLREYIDTEEDIFMCSKLGEQSSMIKNICRLADLMACREFIRNELRHPTGNETRKIYTECNDKFNRFYGGFLLSQGIECSKNVFDTDVFSKGYKDDAGIDILLKEDVIFMPMSTTSCNLTVQVTPKKGEMAFLCARTSAAKQGLSVATCPIDPNYTGDVIAIVHNVSNELIEYRKGEAFCQYVKVPIIYDDIPYRKEGERTNQNLRSTGK